MITLKTLRNLRFSAQELLKSQRPPRKFCAPGDTAPSPPLEERGLGGGGRVRMLVPL